MRSARVVWVALSPSVDISYRLSALEIGGIARPLEVVQVPGGKGFNAARVGEVLGLPGIAVGVVGGPAGDWIGQSLLDAGIATRLVRGSRPTRTCVSLAHGTQLTEVYPLPEPLEPGEWAELAAAVEEQAVAGGWVLLSGSAPAGEAARDGVSGLVSAARRAQACVGVDSSGETLQTLVESGVDLVKVNVAEARELLATAPAGHGSSHHPAAAQQDGTAPDARWCEAVELTAAILDRAPGTRLAAVTDGSRPAALRLRRSGRDTTVVQVPPTMDELRFPVGSGDAFFAGLVTELTRTDLDADRRAVHRSLGRSLELAIAAGAANAARLGAGVLDLHTVDHLLDLLRSRRS